MDPCGVEGPELVNKRIAKEAVSVVPILYPLYSLFKCKRTIIKASIRREWIECWAARTTGRQLFELPTDCHL